MKTQNIKQYIPLAVLTLLAAVVVVLGVVSAARAQGFVIESGDAGSKKSVFEPLSPHPQGRFMPTDDMRPTRIGRAGRLPSDTFRVSQQPQPPQNLAEMPSLSDKAKKDTGRLGPDMTQARRMGDVRRLKKKTPPTVPDFAELGLNNTQIRSAQVRVHLKEGSQDKEGLLTWRMNPLEYPIFIEKINTLNEALSGHVVGGPSGTPYAFTQVQLIGQDGKAYAPVSVYQNRVRLPGQSIALEDENHNLETWVLGTAKRFDQREMISQLIQVMSYEQCKTLGHTLVDALPRQCILPDGTTFIEIDEKLTPKDREISNFDACLKGSHPIVNSFPRKCVAPGGRVYVEPPKL